MYKIKIYPTSRKDVDVTDLQGYEFDVYHFNMQPETDGDVIISLGGDRRNDRATWLSFGIQTDLVPFSDVDNSAVERLLMCAMQCSALPYMVLEVVDYPAMADFGISAGAKMLCTGAVTIEHRNDEGGKSLSFDISKVSRWTA